MSGLLEIKTVNNTYSGGALKITDQLGNSTFITRANGTTYISADGTTDHFLLSSSGAGTFAGNLTVSGQTTNLGTGGASIQAYSSGTMRLYSASGQAIALFDGGSAGLTLDGSHNATLAGNLTVSGGTITSGSGTLTLKSSANTVVLQSASTTALTLDSSQNANFAAFIYQKENQALRWTSTGASGGTIRADIYADNTGVLVLRTGSTPTSALTLGADQNATFAGKVLTAAGTAAAPTLTFSGDSDTGFYNAGGNQVGATAGGAQVWNTTSNGLAMALGKDIYVGNAYVAGAPTATGYIVIKDSTGTSYKIPAVAL
jgi:hypothetical protein